MTSQRIIPAILLSAVCAVGLSAARAAPRSAHPGGYGPIRLGMPEAEAKVALTRIAKDVAFLSMAVIDSDDEAAMAKMVVSIPWEDTYVGTINPTTRIQFGVHDGHVASVDLRTKLATEGQECRTAFAALVQRSRTEFGPIQVADVPGGFLNSTNGAAGFAGWTLSLGRLETHSGACDLMADYDSDAEKGIEARWRASRN